MINLVGLELIGEAQRAQEQLERDLITNTSNIFGIGSSLYLTKINPGFKIVSVMRIEFMDEVTCKYCSAIHGMVMAIDDPRFDEYLLPHPNCRGTFFYMTDQMPIQYTTPNWVDPPSDLMPKPPRIVKVIEPEPFVEKVIEVEPIKPKVVKKPKFEPAETIEGAKDYAIRTFGLDFAEFGELDLEVINMMNEVMFKAKQLYPKLVSEIRFVGSIERWKEIIKDDVIEEFYNKFRRFGYSEDIARKRAINAFGKEMKVSTRTMAISMERPGGLKQYSGICIGERYGGTKGLKKWKKSEIKATESGWKPRGTEDIRGVMWHELGHKAEVQIIKSVEGKSELQQLITEINIRGNRYIKEGLSGYATTSPRELISEAFAEAMLSDDPREVAKMFKGLIDKYCKE